MGLTGRVIQASQEFFVSFGAAGLFAIALIESIFFPVPPDLILIPLALAVPESALFYALLATLGSVIGAVIGYEIGLKGGRPLLEKMVAEKYIARVEQLYDEYGIMAVGIAGFTPIPYKVFTLSSGAFKLDRKGFIAVSLVSRGARFFLEAYLLMRFGGEIVSFLKGPFGLLSLAVAVLIAAAYVVWKLYFPLDD